MNNDLNLIHMYEINIKLLYLQGQWSNDDGSHGDSHRLLQCVWEGRVSSPFRWLNLTTKEYKEKMEFYKNVDIETLALTSLDPTNLATQAETTNQEGRSANVEEEGQEEEEEEDWDRIEERNKIALLETEEEKRKTQAAQIIVRVLRLNVMRKRLIKHNWLRIAPFVLEQYHKLKS